MRTGVVAWALVAAWLVPFLGVAPSLNAAEKGYLGVYLSPSAPQEAGTPTPGVQVVKAVADGPAAKAGLKAGDWIVSAAKEPVNSPADLTRIVQGRKAGESLELSVKRGDESLTVTVSLGAVPGQLLPPAAPERPTRGFLGVGFGPVHPAVAAHLKLEEGSGVLVGDVLADSPADKAGLKQHDVLLSVGGEKLSGPDSLNAALAGKKEGDKVQIEYIQRGERKSVEVVLGKRPASLPPVGLAPPSPGSPFDRPWSPDRGRRGRVLLQRPDGQEYSFPLPGGHLDAEKLLEEINKQFSEDWRPGTHDEMSERIRQLLERLQNVDTDAEWSTSHSSTSVFRVVEGEYDVTVREENGLRTVDVKKGDEVLAENLPWDQVKTLPEEARKLVEKVGSNIKVRHIHKMEPTPPKARPEKLPKDKSIKA